jgi:hypothetical protein
MVKESLSPMALSEESCHLVTIVDCRLEDGEPCSTLSLIPAGELNCTARPIELGWLYRASSCKDSIVSQIFECTDYNGGPGSAFMVHVTISSAISNDPYFSGPVFQETGGFPTQKIIMKNGVNTVLDMNIHVVIRRDSIEGEMLQAVLFSIACDETNELVLGNSFGALELTSFRNEGTKARTIHAAVTWKYSAQNLGIVDSSLEAITTDTNGDRIAASPDLILSPGHAYTLFVRETISLDKSATFTGELMIVEDNGSSSKCTSAAHYTFFV